jgi:peptidoglycan/LPS O-acetylase OafA/YrhL
MSKKKEAPPKRIAHEITDLTVCRALLAAWVFIYHVDLHAQFAAYLGPLAGLVRRGYLGVDGFFLLSGMILSQVHVEFATSRRGTFRFWGKRLARIYPVHLATILFLLALTLAGAAAGITARDPNRFAGDALLANLLLVHGWGFSDTLAWNYPSWSVSSEWAGYLLFPLLFFTIANWSVFVAVQITVLTIPVLGELAFTHGHSINITGAFVLARFFLEFGAGIAAVKLIPMAADLLPGRRFAAIGLFAILAGAALPFDLLSIVGFWLALFSLTVVSEAGLPPVFGGPGILRALGLLSYSFYMSFAISELLLAQAYRRAGADPAAHKFFYSMEMTGVTLMLATAIYFIVERPFRRLGDRFLAPPGAPAKTKPLAATPSQR